MIGIDNTMKIRPTYFCRLIVILASLSMYSAAYCSDPLTRIAAGSCNRQDLPQPLWDSILKFQPQLWVWLGDNIYGDTDDMALLAEKWMEQKKNRGYKNLIESCLADGIWDDHDYGRNDAGSGYEWKSESQRLFLDFLDEPVASPRRMQSGIYASRVFGPEGQRVCLILLDVRTHRDAPRTGGDILGKEQWEWLENSLRSSTAQIHIICSGSQILPAEHRHEKWNDYPGSRERLLKLIGSTQIGGVILLSGDRHFAEFSRLENPWGGRPLHEMTTSGLTHFYKNFRGEKNSLRVGETFAELNFGTISIHWETRHIELAIRDAQGVATRTASIAF
jgi:alkaline phosphatase D